jgi:hypothetical protein
VRRDGDGRRDGPGPVGAAAASGGAGPDGEGLGGNGNIFGNVKEARSFLLVLHGYQITKFRKLAGKSRTIWRTSFPYQRLSKIEQKDCYYNQKNKKTDEYTASHSESKHK